ncbi:hypothetical protein JCM8097_007992 [Rhodosporidiobolus ruineniae]
MASSNTPKCCVCGQPAASRCSSCGKVGVDQFYCSVEHQRLVYPTHKLVCGAKSKPFLHPSLREDERRQLQANELACIMVEPMSVTAHEVPIPLKRFFDYLSSPPPPNEAWFWLKMLLSVRLIVQRLTRGAVPATPTLMTAFERLTGCMAATINAMKDMRSHSKAAEEPCFVEMQHLFLNHFTVCELGAMHAYSDDETAIRHASYIEASLRAIREWVDGSVGVPKPILDVARNQHNREMLRLYGEQGVTAVRPGAT